MNRVEHRCLVSAAAAHGALFLAIVFLPAFASRRPPEESPGLPPIDLVDTANLRLTDGVGASGGTPPPVRTVPIPVPAPAPDRVVTPPPRITPEPELRTESPEKPAPTRTPTPKPPKVEIKPDLHTTAPAQDMDPRKAEKKAGRVKINPVVARATDADAVAEAKAREAEERRAAAEAAARAERVRRDVERRVEGLRSQVGSIRENLEKNLTGQTDITVPGPGGGGEVWMGYGTYLKSFYEARWRRPSSLPAPVASVGVSITITRDGTLKEYEILEKSPIGSLNDSVNEVLRKYRKLDPLPAGSSDLERTFRIKFRLESSSST